MVSFRALLLAVCVALSGTYNGVSAAAIQVTVHDNEANQVDAAVVTLLPLFGEALTVKSTEHAVMKQQNTMFQPFVLPVRTGTTVSFPNFDEFRHHVYSFSRTKRLELRLYGKDESNEIVFDQAGVVALGCNIHDNMLAYIYVTDDPYYQVTGEDGITSFKGLPSGTYKMSVWHPDQKTKHGVYTREITIAESGTLVNISLEMRSTRRHQKGPDGKEYH